MELMVMRYSAKQLEKQVQRRIAFNFAQSFKQTDAQYRVTLPKHLGRCRCTGGCRIPQKHVRTCFTKSTRLIVTGRCLPNSLKDWKQSPKLATVLGADSTSATIGHSSAIIQQQKTVVVEHRQSGRVLLPDFKIALNVISTTAEVGAEMHAY